MCITTLKKKLDSALSESIFFLHALSGCDTTSRSYSIGKVTVLTKYTALNKSATVFMSPSSSQQDIQQEGEDVMLMIYGCTTSPSLNAARTSKFPMKVTTSTQYASPEKLSPMSDSASFHSHRTYHQVQSWHGNDIASKVLGWKATPIGPIPIRMTQPAVPERLLKIIRCNCGGQCDTKTCNCRKDALQCTPTCGQ